MIPAYNSNHVLPPYLGDANSPHSYSPYPCDIMEFCQHFATNTERIAILKGFVQFRLDCLANGIVGRQWIDGDFVEDIEASEERKPEKMVVTTLMEIHTQDEANLIKENFPEFIDPRLSVPKFKVDHYVFVTNQSPDEIITWSKFWNLLYGHNRRGVWKGMLEIPLTDNNDNDQIALGYLNSL